MIELPNNLQPGELLTVNDLQSYVKKNGKHWSRTYIHYLVREKKINSLKIGASRLFLKDEVISFLSSDKRRYPLATGSKPA